MRPRGPSPAGAPAARRASQLAAWLALAASPARGAYYGAPGILGEYFSPVGDACETGANGSVYALDGRLPNITRRDNALNFQDGLAFGLDQCAFELGPSGKRFQVCRGAGELRKNFAARWTGYIGVQVNGTYTFQIDADDGARLFLGHNSCPGPSCGTREQVLNMRFGDLDRTSFKDNHVSFAEQCQECKAGRADKCSVTQWGCEPFPLWILEADNGLNGTCHVGRRNTTAARYLDTGMHPFRVEYFQRGGEAGVTLRWSGPDSDNDLIPMPSSAFVFPQAQGLLSEVFTVSGLPQKLPPLSSLGGVIPGAQLLRRSDDLMEDTAEKSEWSLNIEKIGPVMVRWSGFLRIVTGGRYTFRVESDDNGRLIMGGRGMTGEFAAVDNDVIQEQPISSIGVVDMLPGNTPIRIEYLYSPGAEGPYGDTGLPKPPHIRVMYNGSDTNGVERSISRQSGVVLSISDIQCSTRSWTWGGGTTHARDCAGTCYDGSEALIGDYICDNGETLPANFYCAAFLFDNGDCLVRTPEPKTTPRPANPCRVSCPAGNWSRKDCSQCDATVDGMCVEHTVSDCVEDPNDPPGSCNFGRCCVAKFEQMEYWGTDCVAFGAYDNCSAALSQMLVGLAKQRRSIASVAKSQLQPVAPPKATLMVDCEGALCNTMPEDKKRNPFTGLLTEELVCTTGESNESGTLCFEGPWEDTEPNPLDDCQDRKMQYNFCLNRKTLSGRPYKRCCTFVWVDSRGKPQCQFRGIEDGTCEYWLAAYKDSVKGDAYRRIEKELVLNDCKGEMCNEPLDDELGCPDFVIERPKQVAHLIPETIDVEALLRQGGEAKGEPFPWLLVVIPVSGLCLMVTTGYVIFKCIKEPEVSPWHSDKAKIVQDDTFIEPIQDLHPDNAIVDGVAYGVIHPRPFALRQILREQRMNRGPRALRMDPALASAEAATAAHEAKLAFEASVKGVSIEDFRATAELEGMASPVSPLPMRAAMEAFKEMSPAQPETTKVLAIEPDALAAAAQAAAESRPQTGAESRLALPDAEPLMVEDGPSQAQALQLMPGQVADAPALQSRRASSQAALPAPPESPSERVLRRTASMAAVHAATLPPPAPHAVNVAEGLRASMTAGTVAAAVPSSLGSRRPAASARLMRQGGVTGPMRVCT